MCDVCDRALKLKKNQRAALGVIADAMRRGAQCPDLTEKTMSAILGTETGGEDALDQETVQLKRRP